MATRPAFGSNRLVPAAHAGLRIRRAAPCRVSIGRRFQRSRPQSAVSVPVRSVTAAASTSSSVHVVQDGDTLSGVALKYGLSMKELREANAEGLNSKDRHDIKDHGKTILKKTDIIYVGQELTIPRTAQSVQEIIVAPDSAPAASRGGGPPGLALGLGALLVVGAAAKAIQMTLFKAEVAESKSVAQLALEKKEKAYIDSAIAKAKSVEVNLEASHDEADLAAAKPMEAKAKEPEAEPKEEETAREEEKKEAEPASKEEKETAPTEGKGEPGEPAKATEQNEEKAEEPKEELSLRASLSAAVSKSKAALSSIGSTLSPKQPPSAEDLVKRSVGTPVVEDPKDKKAPSEVPGPDPATVASNGVVPEEIVVTLLDTQSKEPEQPEKKEAEAGVMSQGPTCSISPEDAVWAAAMASTQVKVHESDDKVTSMLSKMDEANKTNQEELSMQDMVWAAELTKGANSTEDNIVEIASLRAASKSASKQLEVTLWSAAAAAAAGADTNPEAKKRLDDKVASSREQMMTSIDAMESAIMKAGALAAEEAADVTKAVADDAQEVVKAVADGAQEVAKAVEEGVSDAAEATMAVTDDAEEAVKAVEEGVSDAAKAVEQAAAETVEAVADSAKAVEQAAAETVEAVADGAKEVEEGISDAAKAMEEAAKSTLEEVATSVPEMNPADALAAAKASSGEEAEKEMPVAERQAALQERLDTLIKCLEEPKYLPLEQSPKMALPEGRVLTGSAYVQAHSWAAKAREQVHLSASSLSDAEPEGPAEGPAGYRQATSSNGNRNGPPATVQSSGPAVPVESSAPPSMFATKMALLDAVYGAGRGLDASLEIRGTVEELLTQLEVQNPEQNPSQAMGLLDGRWKLVYTTNNQALAVLSAFRNLPLVNVGDITQIINGEKLTVENKVDVAVPFMLTLSAHAGFEVRTPRQMKVQFHKGSMDTRITTPQLFENLEIPGEVSVLGRKVSLAPVQRLISPVNSALQTASRTVASVVAPEVEFEVPSYLVITYLDSNLRVSRDPSGGVFVMVKDTAFQGVGPV